jgi:hypothetical protein
MSFETRLKDELDREGARLAPGVGDMHAVMRRGRRRQLTSVAGAALVVVLLAIGFGVLLQFVEPSPGPVATVSTVTQTTAPAATTTTTQSAVVAELVVAGPEGITLVRAGGPTSVWSEGPLMLALDDLQGGFVFQVGTSASSIMRLPAGSEEPAELIAQQADEALQLQEVAVIEDSPKVAYTRRTGVPGTDRAQEDLHLHDLATGADQVVGTVGGFERGPTRVSYGGGRFLLSMSAEGFTWFEFLAGDGSPVEVPGNPRTEEQSQEDFLVFAGHGSLAPDGSTMAYLRGHPRSEAPFQLVVVDLGSGEELMVTPVEGAHDTTVTRLEWDGEAAVVSFTDRSPVVLAGGQIVSRPEVAGTASLIRSEEPPPQTGAALPPAVAATRESILEAAAAGDVGRLADLALAGSGSFTYSFGGNNPPSREELLEAWQDPELLETMVTLLNLPHTEQDGIFAWPSAFSSNPTDEDWAAVEVLYSEEEIAQMKQFGGYIGYRIGITAQGDWIFFVAGD